MAKSIVLRAEVDRARRRVTAFLATRASAHAPAEIAADAAGVDAAAGYRERIAIRTDGRITFVRVEDVDWLEATGSYVRVYTGDGARVVRASLRELSEHLDPRRFFRIHRSAIINLDRIAQLKHWSHGDYLVVLEDGTELTLARGRRQALEAALGSPF
jgi:two-component system LytT family response regulator